MNVKRRSLLKGMALGGLAGAAVSGSGLASAMSAAVARPAMPTLALVSGAAAQSAFIYGLSAAPAGQQIKVQRTDLDLGFMLGLEKRLRSGQPQRIIGLVDDASAALIVDLARSAGARIQWLGQHTTDGKRSQHQMLSAAVADGCALQMGLGLKACGAGFALNEQRLPGKTALQAAAAGFGGASEQWATSLGFALASLGQVGNAAAPQIAKRPAPMTGTFVSFSIEA